MDKQITISVKTILLTLLFILAGYVIYKLGPIIGIILVSTLIVVSAEPAVKYLMKFTLFNKPIKRTLAVIITYLILILVLVAAGTLIVPPFIAQFQRLLAGLSSIGERLQITEGFSITLADLLPKTANISSEVLSVTISLFSNISAIFSVLVISIYMSIDWINIKERLFSILPDKIADEVDEILDEIESTVGHWVKGEALLMLFVGVLSFIGLIALDVKYPLALAIVAGLLEIIPMLGPFLSAILAGIVAFADVPLKGLGTILVFTLIQQIENNLLVPKIMQRASGFSPIVVLLALLVGSEFFGIIGAILAVPMTMILSIVLKRVLRSSK